MHGKTMPPTFPFDAYGCEEIFLAGCFWKWMCLQSTHTPRLPHAFPPPAHSLVQKFLRNGGHVDARNKDTMWTLLHTASHAGQHRVVQVLVAAGARLESEVEGRYTPLLLCCSCGSRETCPVAVSDSRDEDVESPNHFVECGHVKVSALIPAVRCNRRAS